LLRILNLALDGILAQSVCSFGTLMMVRGLMYEPLAMYSFWAQRRRPGVPIDQGELTAEGRREIAILMSFPPPLRSGFIVADRIPLAPAFAIGSYATA
jgi:hypothetical protein